MNTSVIFDIKDVSLSPSSIGIETSNKTVDVVFKDKEGNWVEGPFSEILGINGLADELNNGLELEKAYKQLKESLSAQLNKLFAPKLAEYESDYQALVSSSVRELQNGQKMDLIEENYNKLYNEFRSPVFKTLSVELYEVATSYYNLFSQYDQLVKIKDQCRIFAKRIAEIVEGINEQEVLGVEISPEKKAILKHNLLIIVEDGMLTDFANIEGYPDGPQIIKTLFEKKYSSPIDLLTKFSRGN